MDDKPANNLPDACRELTTVDIDDTDELPNLAAESTRTIRKHAKSFLRFYRARRILSGNRNIQTVTRERALFAWQYLATVAPDELPTNLREPFREIFDLAYHLSRAKSNQSPVKFVSKILKITTVIDEMVDGMLTDTEKPAN